ncbi:anaerobic benzoate catabolism transcriptional regulator [Desulfosporosinus acididurans]|uniref:Anaerobic benzoate catabolism transcriptional regulator n=1 Tax=Desulfosporosinus acididurans TaxID=476652 RepID=A0A0J1FK13_9FIRM|nr:helix-turn-helix transcriptional regulator [Desulfosporosinus acididurans]KLU63772.1 anaerobic benzoate catabolism transcriptional regulator [Desulfosporosinus acididurans]
MEKVEINNFGLGTLIKENRCSLKLTQKALSKATGLSRSYIADIEAGRYNPSLNSISKIAKALELDFIFLPVMTEIQVK